MVKERDHTKEKECRGQALPCVFLDTVKVV